MEKYPSEYLGREQTLFKHRALDEYLLRWALKLGSKARRLCYVDVFAGPWKSRGEAHEDTSPYIALNALRVAKRGWERRGKTFELAAVFIEENRRRYEELQELCEAEGSGVTCHVLNGKFQTHVALINQIAGNDPAFIFVDPTGWKETPMPLLRQLSRRGRDLMIRIPSEAYRFREREDDNIRSQIAHFFGTRVDVLPLGTSEELIAFYCDRLRSLCQLPYAMDMAIPDARTKRLACWLVVGGHHRQVVAVLRDVEAIVAGAEAGDIREEIQSARSPQLGLFSGDSALRYPDPLYLTRHEASLAALPKALVERLQLFGGRARFEQIWPFLLQQHHITIRDLSGLISKMGDLGVSVEGLRPRERMVKDKHLIVFSKPGPRARRQADAGASEAVGA
jgi:three-Cys-motif partner protein